MRSNFTWDVFLSWTMEDFSLMQRIKHDLENCSYIDINGNVRQLRIYCSHENCFDEFVGNIDENIDESSVVVPIITDNFNKKETGWCLDELTRAKINHNNKDFKQSIIPIIFAVPTKGYKLILDPISAVWKINSSDCGDYLTEAIAQLCEKIRFCLKSRETKNFGFLNMYNDVHRIVSDPKLYYKIEKPFGREQDLENFEVFVEKNDVSIISAGIGMGKTAFIRAFISSQIAKGVDVVMIDARNKSINESLLEIKFEQEEPPKDFSTIQKVQWIKSNLQKVGKSTLVVLDGLSNDGIYSALRLDIGKNIKLIITSNGYDDIGAIFHLNPLSIEALCDLFYSIYDAESREQTEDSVKEIIQLVERHTMTITIVANILKSSKKLLKIDKIKDKICRGELLDIKQRCFVQNDDYCGVSATIKEVLQQLFDISLINNENNNLKADLLRFMFFLPNDGMELETLINYIDIDDSFLIDDLYSAGWINKTPSGTFGTHTIVKWLVKCNLFDDVMPIQLEKVLNKYYNECIRHNIFDSRNKTLNKLKLTEAMLWGVRQLKNEFWEANLLFNLSKINDILGNYDISLVNIDAAENLNYRNLPNSINAYLECRQHRLLLYSMRLKYHDDVKQYVSEYLQIENSLYSKEDLFYKFAQDIIAQCDNYGINKGEILGFCYRTCADQIMVQNLDDKRIEELLSLSFLAREAVKSLFLFETMDTYGFYYLQKTDNKYSKSDAEKQKWFEMAERWYKQAYEYKHDIGKQNGIDDELNPFIGTSNAFLGILYAQKCDYLSAYKYIAQSINIRMNKYGEEHPYVIKCYDQLLKMYDRIVEAMNDDKEQFQLSLKCFEYVIRCIKCKRKRKFLEGLGIGEYNNIAQSIFENLKKAMLNSEKKQNFCEFELIEKQYNDVVLHFSERIS